MSEDFTMKSRTGTTCKLRLELAREIGKPEGDRNTAYELVLPLNPDGHIDATSWLDDPVACTVRHIRPGQVDAIGVLARSAHGRWRFDYHSGHDAQDHQGIRFGDDRFVPQAFVGINEDDGRTHAYRVVSIDEIGLVE
jgi:hypothetical protein